MKTLERKLDIAIKDAEFRSDVSGVVDSGAEACAVIAIEHAKAFAEWALKTDAFIDFPVAQAHYEYIKTLERE